MGRHIWDFELSKLKEGLHVRTLNRRASSVGQSLICHVRCTL
jgi:hypothetical protein